MPRTTRSVTVHPLTLRHVQVVRTVDLTPGMRRVTLSGDQLGSFVSSTGYDQPAFVSESFDDDIRLVFPYPGTSEPVLPVQGDGVLSMPRGERPLSKVYTVRRWNPDAGELDVDFVRHGVGVATTWAYRARPGDRVHLLGPGASRAFPTDADWLLVAGDETAVPAIARMLDEAPDGIRATVLIEVAEAAHRQQLRETEGVETTWLTRDGAEPGTLLLGAIEAMVWSTGRPFAWVAGEQATVRDIRRHLVEQRGMPKEDIEFTGAHSRVLAPKEEGGKRHGDS